MVKELDISKVLTAKRESRHIEFKEGFDPGEAHGWCEIIKDIVAMANSGGGCILFGVNKKGSPSGWDASQLCLLDPAQITDKIASDTSEQFSEFDVQEVDREGQPIALMTIRPVHIPLIFTQPGSYLVAGGKQKTAFGRGTVYFRHGAKSEPGSSQDIRQSVRREIESIRKPWLGNIRKVVFSFTLLRTLLHSSKTQPFSFQAIAHSLPKTEGPAVSFLATGHCLIHSGNAFGSIPGTSFSAFL